MRRYGGLIQGCAEATIPRNKRLMREERFFKNSWFYGGRYMKIRSCCLLKNDNPPTPFKGTTPQPPSKGELRQLLNSKTPFRGLGGEATRRNRLVQKWKHNLPILRILGKMTEVPVVMVFGAGNEIGEGPDHKGQGRKIPCHQREAGPFQDLSKEIR